MTEAPSFTWQEDPEKGDVQITQGTSSIEDILKEITRQAIDIARTLRKLHGEPGLPTDDELQPLLANLSFPDNRTVFRNAPPFGTTSLVDIDYYKGLPVKLAISANPEGNALLFSQRLFDSNQHTGATLYVLQTAAAALDIKNLSTPI